MAPDSSNQATQNQQAQNTQQEDTQQAGQPPDTEENTRYEQNMTEQEIADNTPVRKNDPRTSVQKTEEYRFANNIPGDRTVPEQAYADYTLEYDQEDAAMNGKIPDVLLDVPVDQGRRDQLRAERPAGEGQPLREGARPGGAIGRCRRVPRQGEAGHSGR